MGDSMEVLSLRNWFPEEFDFRELSDNEVFIAKGGAEDSTLAPYLDADVVKVLESHDHDSLILEKRVNDTLEDKLREPAFAALVDEAGSTSAKISPNILYARKEGDEVFYGQEFLQDYGPFTDRNLNTLEDAERYLESAGEVTGLNNWLGLAHGDMFQIYPSGPLRGLPKDKNLMFGSGYECVEIDMEDAHFSEESFHKEDHASGLVQMNSSTSDEEYDSLRDTLMVNLIYRHLPEYFDRVLETDLMENGEPNTNLVTVYAEDDPLMEDNTYKIDISKLASIEEENLGEPNHKFSRDLRRLDRAYEDGVDKVAMDKASDELSYAPRHVSGLIREIEEYSTTETDLEVEADANMRKAARQRWQEIYDGLNENL